MKILFDLLHPAHVHFFKNVIRELEKNGHQVIVTSREKDHTVFLLDKLEIKHTIISAIGRNKFELLLEFFLRTVRLMRICKREKPDLLVGVMGVIIAPVGRVMGIPSHTYYDTEAAAISNKWVYRLTSKFITPEYYTDEVPHGKHVTYNGFKELAYLHQNRFIPNPTVIQDLGLNELDKIFVLRFVSWGASHDVGHKGLSNQTKRALVEFLKSYGKVIVTSESDLPDDLEPYRMRISPDRMHDLLYYTQLFIGEGATMASECAMLGTPAIYVNSINAGTLMEQEKMGLIYNFRNDEKVVELVKDLVVSGKLNKAAWREKARIALAGKVDLTSFILKMITGIGK